MAATPKYGLEAPDDTDLGDGPTQQLDFLQQIEDLLSTGDVDMTTGTIKVAPATDAAHPLRRDAILYGPVSSPPATLAEGQLWFGY
jgi:hypothetical protein